LHFSDGNTVCAKQRAGGAGALTVQIRTVRDGAAHPRNRQRRAQANQIGPHGGGMSCHDHLDSPTPAVTATISWAWSRYHPCGMSYRFPQRLEAMRSRVALAARRSNSSASKPGPTQFR